MVKKKQTYKYIEDRSIVYGETDEYKLSQEEYYQLYSFFVTYSLCKHQSAKQRQYVDYGWPKFARKIHEKTPNPQVYLKDCLTSVIDIDDKKHFVFTDEDNLAECFEKLNLQDGRITDLLTERAVIAKTSENNKFFKLFYRIRDGLAHGKFSLRLNENEEKVIVIQDNDRHNVTARIVLKLQTLLDIIDAVDKNGLITTKVTEEAEVTLCAV